MKRAVKSIAPEAGDKIQDYLDSFTKLLDAFQRNAVLVTEMTVLQIKFVTQTLEDKLDDIGKAIYYAIF